MLCDVCALKKRLISELSVEWGRESLEILDRLQEDPGHVNRHVPVAYHHPLPTAREVYVQLPVGRVSIVPIHECPRREETCSATQCILRDFGAGWS